MPGDTEIVSYDDFDSHFPGRNFGKRRREVGSVDGSPLFYRAGTPEARGVRVTLRGDLRDAIATGDGFLGVRRGRCYLIPLALIRGWLGEKLDQHQTVDIRIDPRRVQLLGPGVDPVSVNGCEGAPLATTEAP